jgi:hypothetical protein
MLTPSILHVPPSGDSFPQQVRRHWAGQDRDNELALSDRTHATKDTMAGATVAFANSAALNSIKVTGDVRLCAAATARCSRYQHNREKSVTGPAPPHCLKQHQSQHLKP